MEDVLPMLREAEVSGLFAAGFVSYEAAPAFDHALQTHSSNGFPLLCLGLFHAPEVLEGIEEAPASAFEVGEMQPSVSKPEFSETITEIKKRIAEGATYQVNYTYRLNALFSGNAWAFFYELVKGQKAEHAAYIEFDDHAICSASPELFFQIGQGNIVSRPMKGTARRGRTLAEDWRQAEALRNSEKDRAENIMIVDMIRNDIGRIAMPGSVETVSTYDVEKYPTVWQMTSTVKGRIEPRMDESGRQCIVSEVFKALFPCASITGAPKAKTMEIIRRLEISPRNIYTGSMGFISPRGEACFNVAIRTALIDRAKGQLEFGVGGGIVWDSDAEAEYEETLTKARVLTQPRPDFKLLETMLWEPETGIFLLDEHLKRLGRSAAYFGIPLDVHAILQGLEEAVQHLEQTPHRVRLLVSRNGSSKIETAPHDEGGACSPGTPRKAGTVVPTLRIALANAPVDSQDIFLFHKTTHRTIYDSARAEHPGFDDVVLWNERGEVTEGCLANIVVRKNGKLMTPPVECGLLAGTFREYLLNNGEVEEGIVSVEDLAAAEEIFMVNSVRKWKKASLK
jgi:para-aminobenzoate synthetase/4-amino-4-deoxychorismate lyase